MQAARGTSLSSSDPAPSPDISQQRKRYLPLFAAVALLGYVVDLGSKQVVLQTLQPGERVPVVGDVLSLFLTFNSGAAFSLGTSYTFALSCVAILAALVALWFARRIGSTGWAFALGFLLAGILGNLTDRIFRAPGPMQGHVVDFLRLPNFPVFNVADICINIAAALIILQTVRGVRLDGSHDRGRHSDDPQPEDRR
jgi:signal peptidase II